MKMKMEITSDECQTSMLTGKSVKILNLDPDIQMDVIGWSGKVIKQEHRISVPLLKDAKMPEGDWDEIVVTEGKFKGNRGFYRRHTDS